MVGEAMTHELLVWHALSVTLNMVLADEDGMSTIRALSWSATVNDSGLAAVEI
jgi:hypothetical protein